MTFHQAVKAEKNRILERAHKLSNKLPEEIYIPKESEFTCNSWMKVDRDVHNTECKLQSCFEGFLSLEFGFEPPTLEDALFKDPEVFENPYGGNVNYVLERYSDYLNNLSEMFYRDVDREIRFLIDDAARIAAIDLGLFKYDSFDYVLSPEEKLNEIKSEWEGIPDMNDNLNPKDQLRWYKHTWRILGYNV